MSAENIVLHKPLWQQLVELDGRQTSQKAKYQYIHETKQYIITLLNKSYTVSLENRQITETENDSESAGFLEQLCILSYLINAKQSPCVNKLVKVESFPGGQFFFRGAHTLPTEKLLKTFGENPQILHQASLALNAKQCDYGDASVEILVLPKIPLTLVIWGNDEEFVGRASILFDQTASLHLPLDALFAVITISVNAIIQVTMDLN